jgi:hypothetical protein
LAEAAKDFQQTGNELEWRTASGSTSLTNNGEKSKRLSEIDGVSITACAKRFNLTYTTIAHCLKREGKKNGKSELEKRPKRPS